MSGMKGIDPSAPVDEIVTALAKHEITIAYLDDVFELVKEGIYLNTVACDYGSSQHKKLNNIPTCELVDELEKREGVEKVWVAPYEPYAVRSGAYKRIDDGPACILIVID
jgi:hypothetical protein